MLNRRSLLIANSQQGGGGYVTNGLVFHTDGIENHSAQTVVDLCGNFTPTIAGNNRVQYDATDKTRCLTSGYFAINTDLLNTNSAYTISICAEREMVTGYGNRAIYWLGISPTNSTARSNLGYYNDYTKMRWWRGGDTVYAYGLPLSDMYNPHTIDLVSDDSTMSIYVNGTLKDTTAITISDSKTWTLCFGGYAPNTSADDYEAFYSARLYNRALTADEIAQNYATDKARFNI